MSFGDLRLNEDVSPAAWIAPTLSGGFGAVTRTVPAGYAAYVRICHPVRDAGGRAVRWADVAQATGGTAHPRMQWHALVGSTDPLNFTGARWPGTNPARGNLAPDALAALCEALAPHTATADECWFCLWDGYGWPNVALDAQAVELPGRRYLLLAGTLAQATQIVSPSARQSPNLFWPADRAWCVATELDFDSTLVGGSDRLIQAILANDALDAWPIQPDDSLAHDADLLNTPRASA